MGVRDHFEAETERRGRAADVERPERHDPRWAAAIPVVQHAWAETVSLLGEHGVPATEVDGRAVWQVPYRFMKLYLDGGGTAWTPLRRAQQHGAWPPGPTVLEQLLLRPEPNFGPGLGVLEGQWRLAGDGQLLAYVGDDSRDVPQYAPLDDMLAAFVRDEVRKVSSHP